MREKQFLGVDNGNVGFLLNTYTYIYIRTLYVCVVSFPVVPYMRMMLVESTLSR